MRNARVNRIFEQWKCKFLLLIFVLSFSNVILGQSLEGYVLSANGDTLYFASVFLQEKGKGVSANAQGRFIFQLPEGEHKIAVQYIGYQTLIELVQIDPGKTTSKNFVLHPVPDTLSEVEVKAGKEDPAMEIMRKAIAKRRYHRSMYASYSCEVYIKGTGMLLQAPLLIRKQLERDGIALNRAFTVESRSVVNFKQPDSLSEKVIAIRTVGNDQGLSPGRFLNATFYDDNVGGVVSPLSDRAMSVYRFAYRGTIEDEGRTIYRIAIIPRRPGDDTFSGLIYLVEDTYAIHSTDVTVISNGIEVKLQQVYRPVNGPCWMPVQHRLNFNGKIIGVGFDFKYVANVDRYEVELDSSILALDIRLDPVLPTDVVDSPKQVRRQLRKSTRTQHEEEDVVVKRAFEIDTIAFQRDLDYWELNRPVPLTDKEVEGYVIADSLAKIEETGGVDSTKAFSYSDIILGSRYRLANSWNLRWHSPLKSLGYNTVEGFVVGAKASLIFRPDSLSPVRYFMDWNHRYGFSSDRYFYSLRLQRKWRKSSSYSNIYIEGGHTVVQFNRNNPIHPLVNSLHTTIAGQNFMKIYRQKYLRVDVDRSASRKLDVQIFGEISERSPLENQIVGRRFTNNLEDRIQQFRVLHGGGAITWRPGLKYYEYNKVRRPIFSNGHIWQMNWRAGVYENAQAFLHTELRYQFGVDVFWNDRLQWDVFTGRMFGNPDFPDWQHFAGNRSIFASSMDQFFLLPYYEFSTTNQYFVGMFDYEFSTFLVTQWKYAVQMLGLKEHLMCKSLFIEGRSPYWELGYSLDGIFRGFKIDLAYSNPLGKWGMMIGLGGIIQFE